MAGGVDWDGAERAADSSQAAYFRDFLDAERAQVAIDLAASKGRLQRCMNGGSAVGLRAMSRARREVRSLEAATRELDRMVAALDRRFNRRRADPSTTMSSSHPSIKRSHGSAGRPRGGCDRERPSAQSFASD